ncbi:hypothetical protein JHK85_006822 [Glycine max]|nr:hypothetical protein JHK85_006822 [Glycine max]KAG5071417.1 hypothetical protein JHK86_006628 [Glycine max]KAH1068914.1 hypothetical protein GYH30_006477 [Glycine max]
MIKWDKFAYKNSNDNWQKHFLQAMNGPSINDSNGKQSSMVLMNVVAVSLCIAQFGILLANVLWRISKLCLVNELDDSLLLDASFDGNIQIWKDYLLKGKQKLVIAFSSIHGHKPGVRSLSAVVDWQQQCDYPYASGEISSIMLWDVDKEQLVNSKSSSSDCNYGTPGDALATKFGWLAVLGLAVYLHHIPYDNKIVECSPYVMWFLRYSCILVSNVDNSIIQVNKKANFQLGRLKKYIVNIHQKE